MEDPGPICVGSVTGSGRHPEDFLKAAQLDSIAVIFLRKAFVG